MKGFVHNAEQSFYINGLQMSGVSSLDASYSIPAEENNFLGYVGPADLIQNAPGVGNFSFQRVMMSSDEPITELLLMEEGFDGGVEFNSQEINFQSGYINSYECSFSVDSLPQSTVSISAYGEVGPFVVKQKNPVNQRELFTPTSSGISIDFDGRETNRVLSFSFSMNLDHSPVYKIGSIFPCEVVLGTPIRQNFSIEIEVDDYQTRSVYDYMKTGIHFEDIKVILRDQCSQDRQIEYNFNDAHLLSEQFSTDADNNTKVKLNYSTVSRHKPSIIYR
jgi:hypothetical protein